MKLRIDKYLCDMGIGTRTEIKTYIKKKLITVNDVIVKNSSDKVDTDSDVVTFNGHKVCYVEYEYFLLNKPAGVISATEDRNSKTVIDLITDRNRDDLFPVGRLDKDTEGLLLLTDDGELAHSLLSPKKHVDKVYFARLDGEVPEDAAERFAEGIQVGQEYKALPAKLNVLSVKDGVSEVHITLREGKFHQVKRMCHEIGCEVTYLKRISMGNLVLDETLKPGECRKLTAEEAENVRKHESSYF